MHNIRKDIHKNRLYITMSGVISLSEVEQIRDEIVNEIDALKPGFDIITNLTKYIKADERAGVILQALEKLYISKKVENIVRVIGTSKTALIQFAKYSHAKEHIKIHYFPTMQEAETFLNKDLHRFHKK